MFTSSKVFFFLMERASLSSLPFGVDDPAKDTSQATDISNLIIEIFNEGKTSNL